MGESREAFYAERGVPPAFFCKALWYIFILEYVNTTMYKKTCFPLVATVAKDFLCHPSKKREVKGNILPQLNMPDTTTAA